LIRGNGFVAKQLRIDEPGMSGQTKSALNTPDRHGMLFHQDEAL
jgi:hypothetical protein